MGQRGPAPKPTQLRVLHGDRRDRINTNESHVMDGLTEPPEDIRDESRAVWSFTVEQVAHMRTLAIADRDALVANCEAVVTHRRASALLARSDVLIKAANGSPVLKCSAERLLS